MTLSLAFAGFNYPAFYNGGYENADSLRALQATGANSVALEDEYGIDTSTGQIVTDPNYTDSIASLKSTIAEAKADGQQVMVRPLIDFLDPGIDGGMTGDFRGYFYPTTPTQVNNFFSSYQAILVQQANAAQQAGASVFSLGTEIDQLTGPQFATQWNSIITAVKAVFTGKLTYSADWDDSQSPWQYGGAPAGTGNIETQVSFWNQLDYVGIDEYAPISDAANPTVTQLVAGWEDAPTDPDVAALTGGKSLIQYYEGVSADLSKPLFFTELGYEDATDAASSPSGTSTNVVDQPLQTALYQAFETAWRAEGDTSLVGVNFWNWDPYTAETAPSEGPNFSPQSNPSALSVIQNTFSEAESPPCYCTGTRIRTPAGEAPVEGLAIGDLVVTVSGARRPIRWIGHRKIDCLSHPLPEKVWPVRLAANAVAPGVPSRDLYVSPDHSFLFDDVLVTARTLVNGSTIAQAPVADVSYWHIELDSHDMMLAEGLAAESYLDCANRHNFANGGGVASLHPDFAILDLAAEIWAKNAYAPHCPAGPRLAAIRSALRSRADSLGVRFTPDPGLQLYADGELLTPVSVAENCFRFSIPPLANSLRLRSRVGVPRQMHHLNNDDDRRLGVSVFRLEIDGQAFALNDPELSEGWQAFEGKGSVSWRWTAGDAALPTGGSMALWIDTLPSYPLPWHSLDRAQSPNGNQKISTTLN